MIHYLKIRNFGPIKDEAEMNFEAKAGSSEKDAYEVTMPDGRKLLKLLYIYGANASGKTTVLKAFDFLRDLLLVPIDNKHKELNYDPFLFCNDADASTSDMELSFYAEEMRYLYMLSFNKHAILKESLHYYKSIQPSKLFTRETDPLKRLSKINFGSHVKVPQREKDLLESNTLHNNTVLGAYTKTNVDIAELELLNKWMSAFFMPSINLRSDLRSWTTTLANQKPDFNNWINIFMNKADNQIRAVSVESTEINPNDERVQKLIKNISLSEEDKSEFMKASLKIRRSEISFIHALESGGDYNLPFGKESNGSQRYFGLGGVLYELINGNHLVCIDELETSLHSDLMKHFLQTFILNARDSQMLITTHNISLLEDEDFIRRDALWFSEKGNDGAVSLYSAADFDTTTLRKGASLINAYRSGRLGARPNLGSPYLPDNH